ncbi:hypothetical protein AOQ84DRAFT_385069 [Glonium stellatum]|uniref:Clr5 domain-containing protein n=1 Tax=Glonium stellatum TaxID=574774 RepID=A0A8E2FBI0_9PEZI|nr:hypothetical protein AOQ84DRAFT_385069 [Glonium stellatum]
MAFESQQWYAKSDDFTAHFDTTLQLYMVHELNQVMEIMERDHDMKQYKTQINKWQKSRLFPSKNMKLSYQAVMVRKEAKRVNQGNKKTTFRYNGWPVEEEKITQFKERHGKKMQVSRASSVETPSCVSYDTPSECFSLSSMHTSSDSSPPASPSPPSLQDNEWRKTMHTIRILREKLQHSRSSFTAISDNVLSGCANPSSAHDSTENTPLASPRPPAVYLTLPYDDLMELGESLQGSEEGFGGVSGQIDSHYEFQPMKREHLSRAGSQLIPPRNLEPPKVVNSHYIVGTGEFYVPEDVWICCRCDVGSLRDLTVACPLCGHVLG